MNSADSDKPERHSFGHWHFNANSGNLSDGETSTRLAPQVAKLLEYFLDHQNTLTSRDQLIATVWESRIVSDDAINRCVSILRQILSPDDKNAYIETVVRRGFISHFPAPQISTPQQSQQHKRRNRLALLVFAGLSAVFFYSAFERFNDSPAGVQFPLRNKLPMVAVLPFTTSGLTGDSEFFANGMHDDLLTQLAQLQSIRVISRTSVLEYRNTTRNIREIGRELGVDAILEGGVQRVGDHIRVNAQLIDAKTDEHIWAEQYDRQLIPANIFAVQTEITQAITTAMHATLTDQDANQLSVLPTENMAAYRAYHRAMQIRDDKTLMDPECIAALEEAVALDPKFVRAWAELAGSLSFKNFSQQEPDSIQRIEEILEIIRALAPKSADYVLAQAYFTYYVLKNYERAFQLISQAQNMRPNDLRVSELKSWIQRRLGDFEGKAETTRLSRTLDPNNPRWTTRLAFSLITVHRYQEASEELENLAIKNYRSSVLLNTLDLRKHQDPVRALETLLEIRKDFDMKSNLEDLWDASITARTYTLAEEVLSIAQSPNQPELEKLFDADATVDIRPIITYMLLHNTGRLDQLLSHARNELDEARDVDGNYLDGNQNLTEAFVSAAEGNRQETERLVRVWMRLASEDLAELANMRHFSCRALGMAGATVAATECIRTSLVEPSAVMPFVEPFLPYYDSIREQPEFVDLLTEIQ